MTSRTGCRVIPMVLAVLVLAALVTTPAQAQDFQALLNAVDKLEANLKKMVEQESTARQQQIAALQQKIDGLTLGEGGAVDNTAIEELQKEIIQLKLDLKNLGFENETAGIDNERWERITSDIHQLKSENMYLRSAIEGSQSRLIAGDEAAYGPGIKTLPSPTSPIAALTEIAGEVGAVSISAETDYFSKYVWRGLLLTDGSVFQPSVTADYAGFSFNVWASMDWVDANDNQGQINELDFTAGYGWEVDRFSLAAGLVHYTFPHTDYAVTTELYWGVGVDAPLAPSVIVSWDVDQANGLYVTFDISHSVDIPLRSEVVALGVEFAAGTAFGSSNYNEYYYGVTDTRFTDFHVGITVPMTIRDHWSFAATTGYSAIINSEIKEALEDDNVFTFGVLISAGF